MTRIPKVSIIVPVYNVEKYLSQCLKSICRQTLEDIEIICVNDGSTDNSLQIIERYQKTDERIKCVTKGNAGYGNTMNRGIELATGEYVAIVEADDYIEPDTYTFLYDIAKRFDLDVVKADYFTFYGDARQNEYIMTCTDDSYYYKVIGCEKNPIIFEFRMNTWTGIYKKDFLKKKGLNIMNHWAHHIRIMVFGFKQLLFQIS